MRTVNETEVIIDGYKVNLLVSTYGHKGPVAVYAELESGERYGMLTTNLECAPLPNEIFVKTWSENAAFAQAVFATGLFVDTGRRIPTGQCEAQVWALAEGVTF